MILNIFSLFCHLRWFVLNLVLPKKIGETTFSSNLVCVKKMTNCKSGPLWTDFDVYRPVNAVQFTPPNNLAFKKNC